jgi:hypothetical protein
VLSDVPVSGLGGNKLVDAFNDTGDSFGSAIRSHTIDRIAKVALERHIIRGVPDAEDPELDNGQSLPFDTGIAESVPVLETYRGMPLGNDGGHASQGQEDEDDERLLDSDCIGCAGIGRIGGDGGLRRRG